MTAAQLRAASQLWPECLTDEALRSALDETLTATSPRPISLPMLRAETARRAAPLKTHALAPLQPGRITAELL